MARSTTDAVRVHGALLAGLAAVAMLALLTTWTAALARVPQQRAAVERLLRAQTGLDVRYGRLAVRLGFYGPEAEFGDVEMRRPGASAPLLRAPRMVARFESWRLLRGGQLRPGRVLVSGAELDLRQLLELRRDVAPAEAPGEPRAMPAGPVPPAPGTSMEAADADGRSALEVLESRLPRLLAGIPEGSLDFEALTLLWSEDARRGEPLQLRAPRLYASRRVDGAQLSGTLLLPARFGRTLFVAAQLRDAGAANGGLQGRVRLSGRGLVLARWRDAGALPDWVGAGVGDLTLAAQVRDGRVLHADGEARLAGLALATPAPLVARRFGVAAAGFSYDRLPGARRYQLQQVELAPLGEAAPLFGERGSLDLQVADAAGPGSLVARRVPVELLGFLAARAGAAPWRDAPPVRLSGGAFETFEARWPATQRGPGGVLAAVAGGATAAATLRGKLVGLALGSADGSWSIEGVDVSLAGGSGHLQFGLQARDRVLRAPWFVGLATPPRLSLDGRAVLGAGPEGWSAALEELDLTLADGPRLRLRGAVGAVAPLAPASGRGDAARAVAAADTGVLQLELAEPLSRERMSLLQRALEPWLSAAFWQRFEAGQLESADAKFVSGRLQSAHGALRAAAFAAAEPLPPARELALEFTWDDGRLEGRASSGTVGPLALESGRVSWSPPSVAGKPPRLELEALLEGRVREALELARVSAPPAGLFADLDGGARLAARWRAPANDSAAARARALQLDIDVTQGSWRLLPGAAPLEALEGRLRADGRGLREGRVAGRWLGGPVELRLEAPAQGGPRVFAAGRIERAALQREWAWVELVERSGRAAIDWSAQARADPDTPPAVVAGSRDARRRARAAVPPQEASPTEAGDFTADPAVPWRLQVSLPGKARADMRWAPADGGWRLDRGTVQFGDGPALAGIPGALVVGGRIERMDLVGLAAALDGAASAGGWQRPLVGEVLVDTLDIGATRLGAARLRLAGSRESSSVDLDGAAIAGELRQRHSQPGVLQARFARLQLPVGTPLAALPLAAGPLRGTIELQVGDLRRGGRSLGELVATLTVDDAAVATRDFALRRGAQRLGASGRCERETLGCSAEIAFSGADLGALQRDLGHAPRLQGGEVGALGRLAWTMAPGARFAAGLQGEIELSASLAGTAAPLEAGDGAAIEADGAAAGGFDDRPDEDSAWPLLAPILAVATRQAQDVAARAAMAPAPDGAAREPGRSARPSPPDAVASAALAPPGAVAAPLLPFERLDLRIAFDEGVGRIERYEVVGREARLSIAGEFDFRRGTLDQQADWYWIAPGVSGAVERLDPRSPLAAGLRALRELLARAPQGAMDGRGAGDSTRPAATERFVIDGPLAQPRVERPALLESAR